MLSSKWFLCHNFVEHDYILMFKSKRFLCVSFGVHQTSGVQESGDQLPSVINGPVIKRPHAC